ncbi:MAG: hypothetical protein PHQ12_07150 [Chthoniobacteraceae bacterium]|nr:hypothetical protein [Chthoniobacteraceae bacterium]
MNQHPQNLLAAAVCCIGLAACATHRPSVPEAPIKAPAPAPVAIGTISLVNEDAHFVLVRTADTPAPGTLLQARSKDNAETAQLKVTPEQTRPFIIADVMKGKPHVGEVVTK